MELDLQSLFGLLCTPVLIGWDPVTPYPPAFGLIYEGAIGQPRWTTSLCNLVITNFLPAVPAVPKNWTELLSNSFFWIHRHIFYHFAGEKFLAQDVKKTHQPFLYRPIQSGSGAVGTAGSRDRKAPEPAWRPGAPTLRVRVAAGRPGAPIPRVPAAAEPAC
jgi:hypothetical protein